MQPRVSVVIPTRNRPAMLRAAIDAVLAQTFGGYEIVVVINGPDNPATAETSKIALAAGCRIVRIQRAGIAVALNAGIAAAQGEWIAFLDDDDLWEPNRLEAGLEFAGTAAADVVFCNIVKFDEARSLAEPPLRPPPSMPVREAMTLKNYAGGCSPAIVRRAAILDVGGFDEALDSPDWDLWMRLSWRYRVAWDDAYLVKVREHPENSSNRMSWARSTLAILWKAFKTVPGDLRHLRPRILLAMLKVANKGTEKYIRHTWLWPLRARVGWSRSARRIPPPA
jgi:glycosyltransferase involved in cell wall biosynthesis